MGHVCDNHVPPAVTYHGNCVFRAGKSGLENAEKRNGNIMIPTKYEMFLQEVPADDKGLGNLLLPLRKLSVKTIWEE